jgi:hypothetical protein
MANKKFLLVITVIALVFGMTTSSCFGGLTGGKFTVTDIPAQYNGKYAALAGMNLNKTNLAYVGYQSVNGKDMNTLCRISNQRVSIPMWTVDADTEKVKKYSGSDTVMVMVSIYDSETQAKKDPQKPINSNMFMSISFSNGSAAASWKSGLETGSMKLPF